MVSFMLKLTHFMLIFHVLVPIFGLLFKYQYLYYKGGIYDTGII